MTALRSVGRRSIRWKAEGLFHIKPWEIRGRRMERNAPKGRRCDGSCTHPRPTLNTRLSLCTVCHEVFGTVNNFDRHRKDGWCLAPSAIGLRLTEHGVWRETMDPERIEALRASEEV